MIDGKIILSSEIKISFYLIIPTAVTILWYIIMFNSSVMSAPILNFVYTVDYMIL